MADLRAVAGTGHQPSKRRVFGDRRAPMAHDDAESQTVPESRLTRQVYANFGLALYMAQVLESGLVNVAVWTGIRDEEYSMYADAEADLVALFRKTMGAQRLELLARRPDLAHMEELLTRALRLRNFLARNYFRERAAAFTTEDGQQRMIEELKGAREFFSEVDAEMTKLVGRSCGLRVWTVAWTR